MLISLNVYASGSGEAKTTVSTAVLTSANSAAASMSSSYSNSNSGSLSLSNLNNNISYNDVKQYKNTPSTVAPSVLPTANCMGSSSAGFSISGFGIGGGSSWDSDECNLRETSRIFFSYNMITDAISVLCNSKYAEKAPSCQALNKIEIIKDNCHADEIVARRLGVSVCR